MRRPLRLALRLQAVGRRPLHGEAGLREPRRKARHRQARPERPYIAAKVEEAELDPDQTALLERLLGQDYEVITADDRLDKLADDFVEHCSTRWEAGKSMFVCIDKVTCARMLQRIHPRWQFKVTELKARIPKLEAELLGSSSPDERERLSKSLERMHGQAKWMEDTIVEIVISEAQNEMRDFQKWDFDIIPHRLVMRPASRRQTASEWP